MVHSLPDSFLNSAIVSIPNDRNISITCESCIALSSVYLKIVDTISDINTVLHKYSILATLVPVDSSFVLFQFYFTTCDGLKTIRAVCGSLGREEMM